MILDWLARAFNAAWAEGARAIADIRNKLVDEGWFGRKTPEPQRDNDLGWTLGNEDKSSSDHDPTENLMDRLHRIAPEHFTSDPSREHETPDREHDRGIDR